MLKIKSQLSSELHINLRHLEVVFVKVDVLPLLSSPETENRGKEARQTLNNVVCAGSCLCQEKKKNQDKIAWFKDYPATERTVNSSCFLFGAYSTASSIWTVSWCRQSHDHPWWGILYHCLDFRPENVWLLLSLSEGRLPKMQQTQPISKAPWWFFVWAVHPNKDFNDKHTENSPGRAWGWDGKGCTQPFLWASEVRTTVSQQLVM